MLKDNAFYLKVGGKLTVHGMLSAVFINTERNHMAQKLLKTKASEPHPLDAEAGSEGRVSLLMVPV